jgi:hypothetical protein
LKRLLWTLCAFTINACSIASEPTAADQGDPLSLPQEPFIPSIKTNGKIITIDARRIRANQLVSLVQYMKADSDHSFRFENLPASSLTVFLDFLINNNIIQRVIGMKVVIIDPRKSAIDENHFIKMVIPQIRHFLSLDLAVTGVTDRLVQAITNNLKELKVLRLHGEGITDESMPGIANSLSNLLKLSLLRTSITDAGLTPLLNSLKGLQELEISGDHISDRAIMAIPQRLGNLRSIGFQNHEFDDPKEAIGFVSNYNNLRRLNLSNTNINNEVVQAIAANNRTLLRLSIAGTQVTEDSLDTIGESLHELHSLDMENVPFNPSNEALEFIASELKELRSLRLTSDNLTNEGVRVLSNLPRLEDLSLISTSTTNLSNETLETVLSKCPNLRSVHLSGENTPDSTKTFLRSKQVENRITVEFREAAKINE